MLSDELDFETDLNYLNLSINSNLFCDNDPFLLKNEIQFLEKITEEINEASTLEETEKKNKMINSNEDILKENKNDNIEKIIESKTINFNKETLIKNIEKLTNNFLEKKRKKSTNNKKPKKQRKIHDKNTKDNLNKKYRISCIHFGVNLINDCLRKEKGTLTKEEEIKYLNQEFVSNNQSHFNKNLLNSPLEKIYSINISPQYKKNYEADHNKIIIKEIKEEIKKYPKTNELLKITFSELITIYNNLNNEIKEYCLIKAKTFDKFLESQKKKMSEEDIQKLREAGLNFVKNYIKSKPRIKKE